MRLSRTAKNRLIDGTMAVLFLLFSWVLLGGGVSERPAPVSGLQPDGSYRVVDYDSHVEMCNSDHVAQQDKGACFLDARTTWR